MLSHIIPVESTKIKAISYESSPMILRVEFIKDGKFEYYGVPEFIFEDFINANSKGVFFIKFIKDRYRYVKVG